MLHPHSLLGRMAGRSAVWLYLGLALVPFVFMLSTSVKPTGAALSIPPRWIFEPTFDHYRTLLAGTGPAGDFGGLVINSIIVTSLSTLLTIALAVPAAYALTIRSFGPRRFLSSWILSTYMFPPIVAVIPVFILAGRFNLMDTYWVLVVPYAAFNLPIALWIIRGSMKQIPVEIQEAAFVDGCGRARLMARIMLPLSMPAIATAAILTAILSWNEFLFALSLTRSHAKTAPVGVMEFTGMFGTQWELLTAASTIIVAPILVVTLILRRRIISGLSLGAVK
jgi:ABC-type glycerol-3-phosphate transport system permease component